MHMIVLTMIQNTTAQPGETPPVSTNLIGTVWDFAMKGGVMMVPLGIASLVMVTVFFERLIVLRRSRIIPQGFEEGLTKALGNAPGNSKAAEAFCKQHPSPIANIIQTGTEQLGRPVDVVEKHMAVVAEHELSILRRYLRVLSVVAAIAPLLGLLGTIFGMITAFQTVATNSDALGKTELLAEGIYEAMVTTAAGLLVAIPALICFHWLQSRIERLVQSMDQIGTRFLLNFALVASGGKGKLSLTESHRETDKTKPEAAHIGAGA